MTDIDKQYEELLKKASEEEKKYLTEEKKAATGSPLMTDKDVEAVANVLAEVREDDPRLQALHDMPSSNGKLERTPDEVTDAERIAEGEKVTATVRIDHNTGKAEILSNAAPTEEADSVLDHLDEIKVAEHSIDDISAFIEGKFKVTLEDAKQLAALCKEFKDNPKMTGVYNKMPKSIQGYIMHEIMTMTEGAVGKYDKNLRNMMAENLLISIREDMDIDAYQAEFDDMMNTLYKDNAGELSDLYTEMLEAKIQANKDIANKLRNKAIEMDDLLEADKFNTKADALDAISDNMTEAYTLKAFMEAIQNKKMKKVRPIDLEKSHKIFIAFNRRYEGNENFTINNIGQCPAILQRHFKNVDEELILKFLILFCRYTEPLNPKDPIDHSFMYYFIKNITALDTIVLAKEDEYPKSHEFYKAFTDVITNCIEYIKNVY